MEGGRHTVDEIPKPRKRGQNSLKNNVEQDLRRLLDSKGVVGAFLISKNGDTVAQVFQELARNGENSARHKESTVMPLVKKVIPLMQSMRNMPLRRTVFETAEGSVIFYNTDNGAIGCILDREFDIISIMLEVRTVGELICSHLNNAEPDKEKFDDILRENRQEFRVRNAELLREIENHWGPGITEKLIERTVKVKK
jgi:predicted regulator of Ras-like GTPase activity (Roadblock/LC7/MglB family)